MNILILNWRDIKHPEAGGAEVHLHEIFGRLVKKGHKVYLLTTRFKGSATEEDIHGIKVYRFGHKFIFNLEVPCLVRRILKRHWIDCIVDDVNKIPFFTPRWFPSKPSGVFFHHLFGKTIFNLTVFPCALYILSLEKMSAWGYRSVSCCTVSKSTAADLIAHGFEEEFITIIENSVDTDRYCPISSIPKEEGLLLYTGRLKKYKNVGIVLDVLRMLIHKGRNIRFVIAGTGDDEPNLKKQAERLGIKEHVQFLGYVSETKKIDLYRRAALFINPSLKEGWGITNIESGACGTAVIANDAPGLCDSVKHGKTGFLYRKNDRNDLMQCIEMLLDNPEKRREFEYGGRQWACFFSWDKSADKVETWLSGIVQKR